MKPIALILVAFGPLAVGDGPESKDARKEAEKLRGTWTFSRMEHDGQDMTGQVEGVDVVFEAGRFHTTGIEATFTVDPSRSPRSMDISYKEGPAAGQTIKAIYKLERETLTICRARAESDDRPKEFAAPEGSGRLLMQFKRSKAGSP